jgi:hypothetical protein
LRRMQWPSVSVFGDVTEGVDTKFDRVNHAPLYQVQSTVPPAGSACGR